MADSGVAQEPAAGPDQPGPSRTLVAILALATGIAVANLYYAQPLLGAMAQSLHLRPAPLGLVVTLSQIGYAIGLLFLTPLGDVYARRMLIPALLTAVAIPLSLMALASNLPTLLCASLLLGALTVTPQLIVPLAAALTPPARRGRVVGTVMSGLLIGVLVARTVSGSIAGLLGWRAVYGCAAAASIALALWLPRALPREPRTSPIPYRELIASLWQLTRTQPGLRQSAVTGATLFGAFSVFWTTVTFYLAGPPWRLGPAEIGLLGIAGLAGALAAPPVGRLADRLGPRRVVFAALTTAIAAFALLGLVGRHLWGIALGAAVLDLGVQGGQIGNQTRIYALAAGSGSRVNAVYLVGYFTGGAIGSGLGAAAWHMGGWPATLVVGALLLLGGLGAQWPNAVA